jgi:hypothetical protein
MMFGLPTSETFQLDKDAEQTKLRMTMALSRNRLYSVVTDLQYCRNGLYSVVIVLKTAFTHHFERANDLKSKWSVPGVVSWARN